MKPAPKRIDDVTQVIATCRASGVTDIQFHPDGSLARIAFGPKAEPKVIPEEERLQAAQKKREPKRRDAMDLALENLRQ